LLVDIFAMTEASGHHPVPGLSQRITPGKSAYAGGILFLRAGAFALLVCARLRFSGEASKK